MKLYVSTYVYAADGQYLTENGKNIGKMVIIPGVYDGKRFGNVGRTVLHEDYTSDEGKIFQLKADPEVKKHVVSKADIDLYDEVDYVEPEPEPVQE